MRTSLGIGLECFSLVGRSLAIRGHVQKQFPSWFHGLADDMWNMQMLQIALRLPPLLHVQPARSLQILLNMPQLEMKICTAETTAKLHYSGANWGMFSKFCNTCHLQKAAVLDSAA